MIGTFTYHPRRAGFVIAGLLAALAVGAFAAPGWAAGAQRLYVSASAASDPPCEAASQTKPFATIASALTCASKGSTILLDEGTFAGGFTVRRNVTIRGLGSKSVIAGPAAPQTTQPEVTVGEGLVVTLDHVTVEGGSQQRAVTAGSGTLNVLDSTIKGGFANDAGAGIRISTASGRAKLSVLRSTIAGNFGLDAGSGVYVASAPDPTAPHSVDIVNSTITENQAAGPGGGIAVGAFVTLNVRNSTIAHNTALRGGGVYGGVGSTVGLANAIVAANQGGSYPDCVLDTAPFVDGGHNVIGDGSGCPGATDGTNFDQVGSSGGPIDPHLAPLADNGGATQTLALLLGSPAIGTGDPAVCATSPVKDVDQRARTRRTGSRFACDVGAYDTRGGVLQVLYVKAFAASDPPCSSASASLPFATIAGALACASDGTTIQVGTGKFAGGFTISDNVMLQGNGSGTVVTGPTAPGNTLTEITVADGHWVTLKTLTVDGGGRQANVAEGSGVLNVVNSTIRNGVAELGGGIGVRPSRGDAKLTVLRSTIAGNTALVRGGGVYADTQSIGATSVVIADSTITGNEGNGAGGGLYAESGIALTVRDSTIARNRANEGGGLDAEPGVDSVSLTNTILADNMAAFQPDCAAPVAIGGGHNVVGQADGLCPALTDGLNGNRVGSAVSPLDPRLGLLSNNGGATQTMALLAGSPALGAGDAADCRAAPVSGTDQRGRSRNAGSRGACDIGAYDSGVTLS
jgi:hypothetical protein